MKQLLMISALFLGLCSCGTHGVSPEEIKAAEGAIQSRFHLKKVNIAIISDKRLQVAITGAEDADTTSEGRQLMADSIGVICRDYLDKESLSKGSVIFVGRSGYIDNASERTQSYKMHLER